MVTSGTIDAVHGLLTNRHIRYTHTGAAEQVDVLARFEREWKEGLPKLSFWSALV